MRKERTWALVFWVGIIWIFLADDKDAMKERGIKKGVFANHC